MNIVCAGSSLFTRDVQMGGRLYTEEIQKQFGLSEEDAENKKLTAADSGEVRLMDIITRVNDTIALEIRRSLDFYNSTAGEGMISKVYLSGGAAKGAQLIEVVKRKLSLPVEMLNPFRKVTVNEKEMSASYLEEIAPMVTIAVGLATRRLGDK
jgi:type IV pilus assembly protein PilM